MHVGVDILIGPMPYKREQHCLIVAARNSLTPHVLGSKSRRVLGGFPQFSFFLPSQGEGAAGATGEFQQCVRKV
jgi:hypothetical protein